ncbi:MAG: FAD-binding oxidoreductase [Thermoleophilaceae bacterium]|nr:FAD-binding oxidoreductase [Thermoleophilaceae bacterium]
MEGSAQPSVLSPQEPESPQALAAAVSEAASAGTAVRFVGGHTKIAWGSAAGQATPISTKGLRTIHEHNAGDLTAVVDAGVTLAELQEQVGSEGQMLALDPPLGEGDAATLGGIVATGDSGPLRHRYGSARDLVVGMTVALSDGTLAKSGGKVIKNVAGYDIAKLFTGAYGTLGAILGISVRLHPLSPTTATAIGRSDDPGLLASAATGLSHARVELQSLDVRWEAGVGAVLARFGGQSAAEPAREAAGVMGEQGLDTEVAEDDGALWDAQRAGQRSSEGTVVKVSGLQTQIPELLRTARALEARVVGRAGLGLYWVTLPPGSNAAEGLQSLRRTLVPSPCVVLDAPDQVRDAVDVWGAPDPDTLVLMRRVKERFDAAGVCAPGLFAGGL